MKLNVRWPRGTSAWLIFALLAPICAAASLEIGWSAFGRQIDQYAYDFLFRLEQPQAWQPTSIILALDVATLTKYGGLTGMRGALADGLDRIRDAHPAAVAVDIILAEPLAEPASEDARLEDAFAHTRNLVLSCDLTPDRSHWEDPIARFRNHAAAVGEAHADLDKYDAVNRSLPLEMADAKNDRRWALALEAFLVQKHEEVIESPEDLRIGDVTIPSSWEEGRTIRIRYAPLAMGGIPRISIAELDGHPELAARFAGKVVFAGVTAQTVSDRWMTPYSNGIAMPGIEMHANAYETITRRMFLTDAALVDVAAATFVFAVCATLVYGFTGGWIANVLSLAILLAAQLLPAAAFSKSVVWPWVPGTAAVVTATAAAAAWRHLLVRRRLSVAMAEGEKARYSADHPLRHARDAYAADGYSGVERTDRRRYSSMPEAKRKEIADLIPLRNRNGWRG